MSKEKRDRPVMVGTSIPKAERDLFKEIVERDDRKMAQVLRLMIRQVIRTKKIEAA